MQQFDEQAGSRIDIRFGGSDEERIVIDAKSVADHQIREPSVALLDAKKEYLFTLKPDPDESLIDAVPRIPAMGYGKAVLQGITHGCTGKKNAVIEELQSFTIALATIMGNRLVKGRKLILDDDSIDDNSSGINCPAERQRVIEAAAFIFDNTHIDEGRVSLYRCIHSS